MSCNGCRVLRKGCSDTCALRPCLQWIEGAEAQGNATVFVAKFFGRAGLMGFIAAVPDNQRPALFRSLLYEACGRTVNPVYGAVGLLWSGNWHICQAAVDSVLRGIPLKPPSSGSSSPPANLPCYGPMPNLPRVHIKPPTSQPHKLDDQDFKEQQQLKSKVQQMGMEEMKPQVMGGGIQPSNARTAGMMPGVVVKRERDDQAGEIIAPVARRLRVSAIPAVDEPIDLDLTLSSHPPAPPTPQLLLPPCGNFAPVNVKRAASPSHSFSSEGSVTSLDTVAPTRRNINVPGMDLLHCMERRNQKLL